MGGAFDKARIPSHNGVKNPDDDHQRAFFFADDSLTDGKK
jgi:hypothetical protein